MPKARKSRENPEIRSFILETIPNHPAAVAALVSEKFGISRSSAGQYLKRLEADGLIAASGNTRARRYELKPIVNFTQSLDVVAGMSESDVWRTKIEPLLKDVPRNIDYICHYGFTEIFNNVLDHSASDKVRIEYVQYYDKIVIIVSDYGIGIFEKIQKDFRLDDPRSALLELAKGKLTSDKSKHSGEGIFFTSRMFNHFSIMSGELYYSRIMSDAAEDAADDYGWLIETKDIGHHQGTYVRMEIKTTADWTTSSIFDNYQNAEMEFSKTHVPVALGQYGKEQLISRSQAKRILSRFDKFEEVLLDFQGVEEIGQAFADEIFRVFALSHPGIEVIATRMNANVRRMIEHARSSNPSSPSDVL